MCAYAYTGEEGLREKRKRKENEHEIDLADLWQHNEMFFNIAPPCGVIEVCARSNDGRTRGVHVSSSEQTVLMSRGQDEDTRQQMHMSRKRAYPKTQTRRRGRRTTGTFHPVVAPTPWPSFPSRRHPNRVSNNVQRLNRFNGGQEQTTAAKVDRAPHQRVGTGVHHSDEHLHRANVYT